MLAGFICPDGEKVKLAECLAECRVGQRCLTLATLRVIGNERPWDGTPSVTQLLNGTMFEYLRLTQDYYVIPQSSAYALLGSSHHKLLGQPASVYSEVFFNLGWIKGTADLVELEAGGATLTDFKTYGSYKVAKVLGLRKGQEKGAWVQDQEEADTWEPEMQVNMYRLGVEQVLQLRITRLQLQVTVRDGGLAIANSRGVDQLIYMVELPLLTEEEVLGYFRKKANDLQSAMEDGWAYPCTADECWDGAKCKGYCPVNEHCIRWKIQSRS